MKSNNLIFSESCVLYKWILDTSDRLKWNVEGPIHIFKPKHYVYNVYNDFLQNALCPTVFVVYKFYHVTILQFILQVLRFEDEPTRATFTRALDEFLKTVGIDRNNHPMKESVILKEATNKEQRQIELDTFTRIVCLQVSYHTTLQY